MDLHHDDIQRLAHLCRLHLTEEELTLYAAQLTSVLHEIEKLNQVDTEGVAQTFQVTGLVNVMRPDKIEDYSSTPDELLACSPLPVDRHSIQINRML